MAEDDYERIIDASPPRYRLTFLIGRVSQADVWLEHHLRHLWTALVGFGPARHIVPGGVDPLIQQCLVLVPEQIHVPRVRDAAVAALKTALEAHRQRNRVVHDMWLPAFGPDGEISDPESFTTHRFQRHEMFPTPSTRTLGDVQRVLDQLRAAHFRISSLQFWVTMPQMQNERDVRMIEGRFTLLPDGAAHVELDQ